MEHEALRINQQNYLASNDFVKSEARILRSINLREYSDDFDNSEIVKYVNATALHGDRQYALRVSQEVLLGLHDLGIGQSRFAIQIEIAQAICYWRIGDTDNAEKLTNSIIGYNHIEDQELAHAASVVSRILFERGQIESAYIALSSILPRLTYASDEKVLSGVETARYFCQIHKHSIAAELLNDLNEEVEASGRTLPTKVYKLLQVERARVSLQQGDVASARVLLLDCSDELDLVEELDLRNIIAYTNAWYEAIVRGISLGDAIQGSRFLFLSDSRLSDTEASFGQGWKMVQVGNILAAYNIFRRAVDAKPEYNRPFLVDGQTVALEGLVHTARCLGIRDSEIDALARLHKIQVTEDLSISITGAVHGIDYISIHSKLETAGRLEAIRAIRRRVQFAQGEDSILTKRALALECDLLQECGSYDDEMNLRTYLLNLWDGDPFSDKRGEFGNKIRLSSLYSLVGDFTNAEILMDETLPLVLVEYGNEDELSIMARYASVTAQYRYRKSGLALQEFLSVQEDAQRVFGPDSVLNLKALYGVAGALLESGEVDRALEILFSIEQNPGFSASEPEFKRRIFSKVADVLSGQGRHRRAVNWYGLTVTSSYRSDHEMTQKEFLSHLKFATSIANSGAFERARSEFRTIFSQKISIEAGNGQILLKARAVSASCAESLNLYESAAEEYLLAMSGLPIDESCDNHQLWELHLSVGRNFELCNNRESAYYHYGAALDAAKKIVDFDYGLFKEISWRQKCCK